MSKNRNIIIHFEDVFLANCGELHLCDKARSEAGALKIAKRYGFNMVGASVDLGELYDEADNRPYHVSVHQPAPWLTNVTL